MKMIPERIYREKVSAAEKRVFGWLNAMSGEYWGRCICIHSLDIAEHLYGKRKSEIDFLLLAPDGVVGLEVKGGKVSYDPRHDLWTFTDRYGKQTQKCEGPLQQITDNILSLEKATKGQPDVPRRIAFGWSVVLPDMDRALLGTDFGDLPCYFADQANDAFARFMQRLLDYWKNKPADNWRNRANLTGEEISALVEVLRPEIIPFVPLWVQTEEEDQVAQRITQDQFVILDALDSRDSSVVVGAAGTGKTWLAMEQARRWAADGKQVAFLCFNKLLAKLLEANKPQGLGGELQIRTVHGFMKDSIGEKVLNTLPTDDRSKFYTALEQAFAAKKVGKLWDAFVVDEAQDLLCESFIEPLGKHLKGGWASGRWVLFYDDQQLTLASRYDKLVLEKMMKYAGTKRPVTLRYNLRNTNRICEAVRLLTSCDTGEAKRQAAHIPEIVRYGSREQARERLQELLRMFSANGNLKSLSDVVVLYPQNNWLTVLEDAAREVNVGIVEITVRNVANDVGNRVRHHALDGFKGLESSILVLLGLEDLESPQEVSRNYVALTRGRNRVYVFINEKLGEQVRTKYFRMIDGKKP